ncbi:MAG: glycosyltransferase family 4 protein [Candidatus Methanofastidiosum sp.]|nr:glycosyltransferase family 4 protein [Methanofastidiosum sp.]
MKIIVDGTVLEQPATGIAKSLLELYKKCIELDHSLEVTVIHRKPLKISLPNGIKSKQISINFTDKLNINNILWRYVILPCYILKNRPKFVHFPWNGNVPPFIRVYTNIVLTIHDVLPLTIPDYFKSKNERDKYIKSLQTSINRSKKIFTVSEYSKKEILQNFVVDVDIEVILHGSTLKKVKTESKGNPKFKYFLYVGGYDPRKGLEKLLKVFLKLHEEKKLRNKLVLTGSKNYFSPSFKNLVTEGVNSGIVIEKGYITDEELSLLYSNATALIYPSKYEGFGLPVLEAMSMGCPVITTKCTSIPEVCGDAAYYVDVDNEINLSEALIKLETDVNLQKSLINKGKQRASKFSWSSSAKIFLEKLMKNQK